MLAAWASVGAFARASDARVDIRAESVAFFPFANATLVAARGHVRVRVGRRTIDANVIRYDVTANRITASGDVRVDGRGDVLEGAVYRLDLGTERAYLVRANPLPTTYSLEADDLAKATEGPAPAGTFDQIDLDGQRPYIRSRHAIVVANSGVRMTPAEFPTGAGPAFVLPTFLYTLVSNHNIAQSAEPYASFDQPYNLFGSTNSLTAGHLRYESQNGVTLAVDTRLVDGDRAYAVVSFLPLRGRRADLIAFQQLRPGLQQTFGAAHAFSTTFPSTSANYRLAGTNRFATATFAASAFNTSNSLGVGLSSIPHDVGHYFSYQLDTGYAYEHNLGGYPQPSDFRRSIGANVTLPGITVAHANFGARYDYNLGAYDYPHTTSSGTLTLSGSRRFRRVVDLYASVAFSQIANRYRNDVVARRALFLPDPNFPYFSPDGTPFPGFFAYAGLNTYRSYALRATFSGRSNEDRAEVTLTHTRDFPQSFGYGRPPLTAGIDVIRRLTPTIKIELGRSYTFGYGGHYLSPQYSFGISP